MKIYQKFIAAFSLIALIIIFLALITTQIFRQANEKITLLDKDIVPGAISMLETTASMAMLAIEVNEFIETKEAIHLEQANQAIDKMRNNVERHTIHEAHIGEAEQQIAQNMEDRAKDIIALAENLLKLETTKTKNNIEIQEIKNQIHIKMESLRDIFAEHVALHNDELNNTVLEINTLYTNGTYIIWAAISSAILLLIFIGVNLTRTITQPISSLIKILQAVATGKLEHKIDLNSKNEFGQLLQALDIALSNLRKMIKDIVQVSQGLADGDLQVRPQVEYEGDFTKIKLAQELALSNQQQVIEDIVQILQGLAKGDLQVIPQVEYRGDFIRIKTSIETAANYFQTVIIDLVQISEQLAAGNLQVVHKVEYRGDFLPIKESLEIALNDQRQVIEDIVQVSQGLAQGNLQIMPKVTYRGNFLQIKESLETALVDLRRVIEDIVQVSQGLAAGKNTTFQAEYRGDFVQTQQALQTATTKLIATRQQNTTQDWLKSGQNQLNDQMSGDQNIVELTHNVVSFLTLYLNAQVGVCYLVQGMVEQKHLMKLIASYAQTGRKNLADEFKFSEGLVERAAKELKTIIINIETGLETDAVPPYVIVMPFLHENVIKGVIVLGSSEKLIDTQQDFLHQVMPSIGVAVSSVESRSKMQELLQQTQIQSKELQEQQATLKQTNEALQTQSEELQSQSEELQSQSEELQEANNSLEERTKILENQKSEIQHKNLTLEKTRLEMEQTQEAIRIKAEELELASKYKSEFLANMSHELRTPLNSLLILAQLLADNKQGNLSEKQIEYAKTMHSAGSDLLTLINEILDLSKVEAGKVEIQAEEITLVDLLNNIKQKFIHIAEDKGLEFNIELADAVPTILHTDKQRLNQVINNLLSNAFKFTSKGGIKVIVQLITDISILPITLKEKILLESGKIIAIQVNDTGIGIPQEKQKVIFEAFQQADGTTSRRFGGTGLGLSISRQLARLLGGELYLQSQEGQGSTFTLYLPEKFTEILVDFPKKAIISNPIPIESLPVLQTKASENSPIIDDRNDLKAGHKSILIIEDDRKFANILKELSHNKGFKCLLAEDGISGLQLAEEYKPDAIILDVGLPELDGWSVMERLKDDPETRHIPVHFMSATDQQMDAKKMGAIGYLLKPVSMVQIGEAFKNIEQFIKKTKKKLLIVADKEIQQQKILELVEDKHISIKIALTGELACQYLKATKYDCIILDMDIEQGTGGIKFLEQIQQNKIEFCQIPVIIYTDRDLSPDEKAILLRCSDELPIKSVKSPEHLLDEATIFLHQIEANLPEDKRNMLRMVHDKSAIFKFKKVLIIDDDIRNTYALATVLEEYEIDVVIASNGKEGLDKLEEHEDIVIVLMDIMMPEMDGYEAIKKIRQQSQYRKLPIIALTAKAMKGDRAKCIEAGANDYLSKPVDVNKLLSLMRVWLHH